ncbi:cation:proton antiporter [Henriciella algicola]|uniref:Sodium:proton antiporter n=1 Tax=Henriciella algicola TaxID=1608422 RepID=A0A399RN92_9PROT|nr:cation:proton antiporter [Henriciella algicola]RIJ31784.1 sodium:proton antiporter [Henriciella algicola]
MDQYFLSIAIIGFVGLSCSWVYHFTQKIGVSYAIVYVLLGMAVFAIFPELPWVSPFTKETYAIHLTELMVIIALMTTGLSIDRRFGIKRWANPLMLVSVAMILSIAALAAIGYWWLGLGPASAVLLGAALAPTDPVLASEVQVGPPNSGDDNGVRFALTAEAGMNDGLAFPFTWLAIALAGAAGGGQAVLVEWLSYDVFYRIIAGLVIGYLGGRAVAYVFLHLSQKLELARIREGLTAVAATLAVYGVTELAHGYGFIAVFVCALTIRDFEREHEHHRKMHEFTTQLERALMAILLLLLGGAVMDGILKPLTWPLIAAGLLIVLVVRPVFAYLALSWTTCSRREKCVISFFGIKGIGSFFYLSFALGEAEFANADTLWALTAFVVLISILVHGLTSSIAMKWLGDKA